MLKSLAMVSQFGFEESVFFITTLGLLNKIRLKGHQTLMIMYIATYQHLINYCSFRKRLIKKLIPEVSS